VGGNEEAMKITTIDVSAQFGGRDASQAVLPHFRALKSALKGKSFGGFPFPKLAFILRVDGEVTAFGESGAGNIDFDKKREYLSVDIGFTREDHAGRGPAEVSAFVAGAIMSSVPLLRGLGDARLKGVDWGALEAALQAFSDAYKAQFASG
jgi:hypothetical protein